MDVPSGDDLRGIFETSPAALLLCDRTVIHYANASCAALLGCPDPPAVCRLDPLTGFVAPADQPAYGGVLDRLLAGASEWEQLWVAARRADGGALHVHIRAQRVPHPAGARAFVALVDASGQLEAARRIERLALAVNLVSEAVLIAESDGAITYANRAMGALLETSAEALVGADPLTFLGDHKDLGLVTESLSGPEADRRGSVQLELLTSTGRRFPA
ncbi:MAG: PAS domain-containing protein, partial [Armatimonadetes bacterium]|nr:PAS domain-containing protein [Armatimonadota bacterium]